MANESIRLTFSEDGEHLQLSRLDAAMLLTWILGGDHDADIPETAFSAPGSSTLFGGVEFEVPAFGHEDASAKAQEFVPQAVFEQVQEIWDEDERELPPEETHSPIAAPRLIASSAKPVPEFHPEVPIPEPVVPEPVAVEPEPVIPERAPARAPERHLKPKPVPKAPVEAVDPGDFWTQPTPEEQRAPVAAEPKQPSENPIAHYETPREHIELPPQEGKPYWEIEDELPPAPPEPRSR